MDSSTTTASKVIKIPDFKGRLPKRPLYIYLPPGYDDEPDRHFPVIYMHDGQNCFEAFVEDSYVGSWRADETADTLINQGLMRPCIIVGVGHGGRWRTAEYLPPYAIFQPKKGKEKSDKRKGIPGRADKTFAYYENDVAPYIRHHYRVLTGRDHTATCGSSMGGLFSAYIAWEHPGFARHHAVISPAFWTTKDDWGEMEPIRRLQSGEPRDLRLWLDSGTRDSPRRGDDGMFETLAAREALRSNSYVEGVDFRYFLDRGAIHRESAWAARLPQVFQFLFPTRPD